MRLQEGDLDSWRKKQGNVYLPEETIMIIFVQICLGLLHIHSQACPSGSPCCAWPPASSLA